MIKSPVLPAVWVFFALLAPHTCSTVTKELHVWWHFWSSLLYPDGIPFANAADSVFMHKADVMEGGGQQVEALSVRGWWGVRISSRRLLAVNWLLSAEDHDVLLLLWDFLLLPWCDLSVQVLLSLGFDLRGAEPVAASGSELHLLALC